ncbi:MAG TPA: hypothetical protein VJA21_09545 [Verrucomicrobiae bacterium]
MKPRPVKHYRQPRYPTRLEVLSEPDLLRRNLPPGWRSLPGMAGSIALFLAANSVVQGADKKAASPAKAAVVAPIFDHGEGRGATGCVVVAPPVFLSEEEAWQVIDEELEKRGVKLPDARVELRGVQVPRRMETYSVKDGKMEEKIMETKGSAEAFSVDRANAQKHIAVEFVSQQEYSKAGGPFSMSTVQSYDFRQTARKLAEDLGQQAKDKVYLGVLYDPLESSAAEEFKKKQPKTRQDWRAYAKARTLEGTTESKRLLRLQVQDFLKWLEAQGAI